MTKAELVASIGATAGITKAQAELTLAALAHSLNVEVLGNKGSLGIPHIGTFKYKHVPQRNARNPKTGETVVVAAKDKVVFKPAPELRG